MAEMDPQIADVLARLAVKADAARQRTADAAADARGKPRIMDPGSSSDSLGIPEGAGATDYDFEKPLTEVHGFPAETDVHPSSAVFGDRNLDSTNVLTGKENDSRILREAELEGSPSGLKAKAMSRAHPTAENPAPAKSIEQLAQEDAERILGRKPMAPPKVGELADAPIESMVDSRGKELASPKPEPTPDLSDSEVQRFVDEAQGNGKVLTNAEDAAQLQAKVPKTTEAVVDDLAAVKRSLPNGSQRLAARYAAKLAREGGEAAKAAKWYTNPGTAFGNAAKAKMSSLAADAGEMAAKGVGAVKEFSNASLAGKALMAGKLGWKVGAKGAKVAMKDMIVPAVAEATAKFGIMNMAENAGATGRLPEMPGEGTSLGTEKEGFSSLIDAQDEQRTNLDRYNRSANKYGLKVTGRTSLMGIMGVPGLNRLIAPGPNIQVQEDPDLKAAYLARNHERIKAMKDSWASQQAKGHSE